MQAAVTSTDSVTKLIPGANRSLAHLTDSELLARTQHLVGKSNQVFAALLVHLAEVEARGLHRTFACSGLYTYCIYELRFSEDAAARRTSAARLVKRFPALFDAIAAGELHLTGLLMLGPHLTDENHRDVLGRAKFRTKKEIAKLVRTLAPLPDVPDSIEPLRPALPSTLRAPTWEQFVQSFCPPVRELAPGKRPRDWANDTLETGEAEPCGAEPCGAEPCGAEPDSAEPRSAEPRSAEPRSAEPRSAEVEAANLSRAGDDIATAPARVIHPGRDLPPLTGPQLYQVQFTTSEEHVRLIEKAKALLSRMSRGSNLGELHLQAMRLLVAKLEKKRFAVTARPRKPRSSPKQESTAPQRPPLPKEQASTPQHPRQRGRYIPAAERRAVYERDDGRCTYVDQRGQRCQETHHLEIHHLKPYKKAGEHTLANLALRCFAHNTLAAEEDFGREHITRKRDAQRHESLKRASSAAEPRPDG